MGFVIDKILFPYLKKNKFNYLIYILIVIITYIFGNILLPKNINNFTTTILLKGKIIENRLLNITIIIVLLSLFYCLFFYIKTRIQHKLTIDMSTNIRLKYMETLLSKYTENFENVQESEMVLFYNETWFAYRNIMVEITENYLPYIIITLLLIIYFYTISPLISLIILIYFTLIFFLSFKSIIILTKQVELYFDSLRKNYNKFGDKVKNLLNIILNNNLKLELNNIKNDQIINDKVVNELHRKCDFCLGFIRLCNYLLLIIIVVILYFKKKYKSLSNKNISLIIIMILFYVGQTNSVDFEKIARPIGNTNKFDQKINEIQKFKNPRCDYRKFYSIKFKNVFFRYGNNPYVIQNKNIHFKPKKINILMGKSGSGKTTIMKLIIKMVKPNKGNIFFENINIKEICQKEINENIYYVNQLTTLFDKSILYNMKYGNHINDKGVIELLKKYDLYNYFQKIEGGINSNCGVNGTKLSLGMQKIIMNIRGILNKRNIIIFDEPLTSLDNYTRGKIVKMIYNEMRNRTIIIITHDKEILKHADYIIKI